jgi:hypothetical protein
MKFIEQEFPAMAPRFEKLYARKYPPDAYRRDVKAMVRALQQRYALEGRGDVRAPVPVRADSTSLPEQVGFAW